MVDSNGRVTELEDDAMLPPAGAGVGVAPAMTEPGRADAPPLREMGARNGPASGYAKEPVAESEMHERRR
jgi:hypothetical protein